MKIKSVLFENIIYYLFSALLLLTPLLFFPKSSEIFEFNKIIFLYLSTSMVVFVWIVKMIIHKQIIFRRTILDIPIFLFLTSQLISTIFSIHVPTSLFGYYSRFHGSFLSTVSYSLLFWAFVSNINKGQALKIVRFPIYSGTIVAIYAVLQKIGIDKDYWVQDVQNRVFSTFGQPNWLAAFLVAIIPISWYKISQGLNKKGVSLAVSILIFALFYLGLIFTKSRSGFLGLFAADIFFFSVLYIFRKNMNLKRSTIYKLLLIINSIIFILAIVFGTPWTPSISKPETASPEGEIVLMEAGGTESGEIRKIVWKGALDIYKAYPVFGSGVETFAYSYYKFRPAEHNLVSEWDYLYNKAHNEYLNIAANTGSFGLITYITLIFVIGLVFIKNITEKSKSTNNIVSIALAASSISILVTNFFGFSVTANGLYFILFPAIVLSFQKNDQKAKHINVGLIQKTIISILAVLLLFLTLQILKYWYADTLFAKGRLLNNSNDYIGANNYLTQAINLNSNQAEFYNELSKSTSGLALYYFENKDLATADMFAKTAINESNKAVSLSPGNLNIMRNNANILIKLSVIDNIFLSNVVGVLNHAITLAPTDAKLYYNLGLAYARLGKIENAVETFETAISLKPNYKDARFVVALIYKDLGQIDRAFTNLDYIMEHIDSNDELVIRELKQI